MVIKNSFLLKLVLCSVVLLTYQITASSYAQPSPPAPSERITGLWEQVNEKTKKPESWIRITRTNNGVFEGVIEKIIPAPGDDPNPRCDQCSGERRNQPILGMKIITDLKQSKNDFFDQGEILDPDSGDIYRLNITVKESGRALDVRGYLGISLFGRSQIWKRIDNK
jgi:uncharacterized protein (DUF2147 family)